MNIPLCCLSSSTFSPGAFIGFPTALITPVMHANRSSFPEFGLCTTFYIHIHITFKEKILDVDIFNLSFKSYQSQQLWNTEHPCRGNGARLTSNANWRVHRLHAGSAVACPPPAESLMPREAIRLQPSLPGRCWLFLHVCGYI